MQSNPAAGDGIVVLQDTRNYQRDLYRFDLEDGVPPAVTDPLIAPGALPLGSFQPAKRALCSGPIGSEEGGFHRAVGGLRRSTWREIAVLPAGTTAYTDTAVAPAATYWVPSTGIQCQGPRPTATSHLALP